MCVLITPGRRVMLPSPIVQQKRSWPWIQEPPWFGYTYVHTYSRSFLLCSRFSQDNCCLYLIGSLTVEKFNSEWNLSFLELKFCTFFPQAQYFISYRCEAPKPETPTSRGSQGDEVFRYVHYYVLYVTQSHSSSKCGYTTARQNQNCVNQLQSCISAEEQVFLLTQSVHILG